MSDLLVRPDPDGDPAVRHPAFVPGWVRRPPSRPRLRGRIHQVAAVVAVPAGVVLVLASDSATARLAVLVYAACSVALYTASASYHLHQGDDDARLALRRLDHALIFVLIAGCYTPLCLLALPQPAGAVVLVGVWAVAIAGVRTKLRHLGGLTGSVGSWLYHVLGWSLVVVLPWLAPALGWRGLVLLLGGGLLYSAGAATLGAKRPNPVPGVLGYHEVWHGLGVLAATFHFALIWDLAT